MTLEEGNEAEEEERTKERDGAIDGEDAGVTADVIELAVEITGKVLAVVAIEELDGAVGGELDGDIIERTRRYRPYVLIIEEDDIGPLLLLVKEG